MTPNWTTDRPTKPGEYWLSIDPNKRKGRIDCEHNGGDVTMTDYRNGVRAAAAILLGLVVLCALASLSGCLTAAKIGEWQRAVYGWGMDPGASKPCQVASAEASAYLANANQRLAEAGKLTDLASDSRARELVTSAALACGRRMP